MYVFDIVAASGLNFSIYSTFFQIRRKNIIMHVYNGRS